MKLFQVSTLQALMLGYSRTVIQRADIPRFVEAEALMLCRDQVVFEQRIMSAPVPPYLSGTRDD